MKIMKRALLMLLLSCTLLSFAGCKESDAKQKLIAQLRQETNIYWGTIEFRAHMFAQSPTISSSDHIDVKVVDGNIYLNTFLYDSVEIVNDPEITYSDMFFWFEDESVIEILQQIQNSERCYMLNSEDSVAGKIAVCCIDGTFYFVSFFENGEVMRVNAFKY